MAINVVFNSENQTVIIDGITYTIGQLANKPKNRIEGEIYRSAFEIFSNTPSLFDNEELEELIASDTFKGDFHSQALRS